MRFSDIWGKIEIPSSEGDFPFQDFSPKVLKVFGALCFVCAVASTVLLGALATDIIQSLHESLSVANIVIAIAIALMAIGAIAVFIILGRRLYRNEPKKGERLAMVNIALVIVSFLAMMMLYGLSWLHIVYLAELVFLAVVTVYMDPELAEERALSAKAAAMDPEDRKSFEHEIDTMKPLRGYITLNFFNLFWIFTVCCFLGLVIEDIVHIIFFHEYQDRAGLLYGPFSPIYGFGGLLMTIALNRYHDRPWYVIFGVSAVIGGAFEFFVSWIMQYAFGIVAWDYSGTFLNIDGRTNFMFMCCWGLLGFVWVKALLPMLLWIIDKIPWKWRYSLTTILCVFMVVDVVMTVQTIDCWFLRVSGNPPESGLEQFMAQHYDNAYMEERFQTMDLNPDQANRK